MNEKAKSILKASNTDKDGKPIRLDLGGVRDISKPYAKARFKLIYDPIKGVLFVDPRTKVRTLQPSDFFTD